MENERLDELFKYFRSVSVVLDQDIDLSAEYKPSVAQLSSDPILNSLAQLCLCRVGVDRAFISLIDDRNQYLVAEITKSSSLFHADHHPKDGGIAFGVRALDLATGICAATIPPFTGKGSISTPNIVADTTRYVVNDFSIEPNYADKPYVQGFPHMRYYAGVPIRTASGHVIGTLAAIHNAPRSGLDEEGFMILTEIASSIMRHFELLKIQSSHETALKLLNGLKTFVRDDALAESTTAGAVQMPLPSELPLDQTEQRPLQNGDHSLPDEEQLNSEPLTGDTDHFPSASTNGTQIGQCDTSNKAGSQAESNTTGSADIPSNPSADKSESSPSLKYSPVVDRYHDLLTRAACLVREAMDMDAVAFLQAPSAASLYAQRGLPSVADSAETPRVSPTQIDNPIPRRASLAEPKEVVFVASQSAADLQFSVSEVLHANLLAHYPRGCFLNFTNYVSQTVIESDTKASLHRALRTALPLARSFMHLPLFGPDGTCVRSLLVWSYEKRRILQVEDFSYLGLFGATIEAKFSQMETAVQSRAKSDFISSMSHELRSPLHGILGSAELLSNSNSLDLEQEEMINMIEKCAGSLLATLDHILTYSKINNRAKDDFLTSPDLPMNGIETKDVDLSMIIEDSVDTLTAGNHFRKLSTQPSGHHEEKSMSGLGENLPMPKALRHGPLINLVIDSAPSWSIGTEAPVWARSLINILGNAMKYTSSGIIEVKLQMLPHTLNAMPDRTTNIIKLSVSDTGIGMSTTYLQNHVYQPFLQENPTSDGLGLGLSIVKKLVDGLGGFIDVQSTLGKGTVVEITVPAHTTSTPNPENEVNRTHHGRKICFLGKSHRRDVNREADATMKSNNRITAALSAVLLLYCERWFGMDIQYSEEVKESSASILILFDEDLYLLHEEGFRARFEAKRSAGGAFIIVSTKYAPEKRPGWLKADGIFPLVPPFGPRRLSSIIQQASDHTNRVKNGNVGSPTSLTPHAMLEKEITKSKVLPVRDRPVLQVKPEHKPERHILVVDDNEVNVKLLTKCLEKWKVPHQVAYNGAEAVEAFKTSNKPFDYVLMDISMPVMNGLEATRAIRELELSQPLRHRTQIIAMTGLGDEKTRQEALDSSMDVFLTKPIRLREVKTLLCIS